jgi:crotonobetainyl-CoA:carnitine CoA-transferase CaiB-like acyl-CoA transferase
MNRLIAESDLFAATVRYEGLKRLDLHYEAVCAIRPDIVYVHGSGYGSDGPYAGEPAYDDLIQTASGFADVLSHTDGNPEPRLIPSLLADKVSGLFMGQAMLAALFHRQRTGEGQFVEAPMLECVTSFNLVEHFFGHVFEPPTGPWTYPRVTTPHRKPHPTKDGYIGILPYSALQWEQFFALAGWGEEITKDPRFADDESRSRNIQALYGLLDSVTVTRTTDAWLELLRPLSIPVVRLNRIGELMDDPHLKAVGLFERYVHPDAGAYWSVRPPMRFSATPANIRRHPPKLGEHTLEVMAEIGMGPVGDDRRAREI